MQRRPIRPPDLNGSFLTAIKRACREARGRPIRRLRRLPRLWACSRPPSRRPRPPRRWARPPGRAERGFGGFGAPLRMGAGGAAGGAQWCDAGRGKRKRGRTWARNLVPEPARAPDSFPEARVSENEKKAFFFDEPAHEASSKLLIQLRRWDLGQIRTTRALARCSGNIHGSQEPRVQPRRRIGRCADELGSRR